MVTIILFLILFVYIIYLHIKINKNNIEKMSDTTDASLTESINCLGRITKEILDKNDNLTIAIKDVEFKGNVKINGNLVVDNGSTFNSKLNSNVEFNSHVDFNKETNFNCKLNATTIDASSDVNINGKLKVDNELEVKDHGIFGNAYIGTYKNNNAIFSHKDKKGENEYTLAASNDGHTTLNTSTDSPISIANKGNVEHSMIQTAGIRPTTITNVYDCQQWLPLCKDKIKDFKGGDIGLISYRGDHFAGLIGQYNSSVTKLSGIDPCRSKL